MVACERRHQHGATIDTQERVTTTVHGRATPYAGNLCTLRPLGYLLLTTARTAAQPRGVESSFKKQQLCVVLIHIRSGHFLELLI